MKRYPVAGLEKIIAILAEHSGVSPEDAQIFARSLVDADLHGTSTHGVSRLSIYLERIRRGLIDPRAVLQIDRQHGGVLALDAANGLGQVQAIKALDLLIPLARAHGVAAAAIRRSQHFGALSYYCNYAAHHGMILLAMTNCEPSMSPTGGYDAFFGTNPIAASFPTGFGSPVKIDLATSVVARGNIIAADKKKASIPEGWALTREGAPTTDASEALRGTVLTMAGHKGYALALMVEVFSSILSGAAIGPGVGSMYKALDREQNVGHFFCLFDISAFMPLDSFTSRMDTMIGVLKSGKRRPGVDEILVPGERSSRTAARNNAEGVPIADEVIVEIQQWCSQFGLNFDQEIVEV